jgi:hypothetical protein
MAYRPMPFPSFIAFYAGSLALAVTVLGTPPVSSVFAEDTARDTRTSQQSGSRSNNAKAHDWRRFSITTGSSNNFRGRRSQMSGKKDPISRNAIGIGTNPLDRSNGAPAPGSGGLSSPASSPAKNAPETGRPDVPGQISSPAAHVGAKMNFPTVAIVNQSVVNGSGLAQRGSGTAAVGGPAKNIAGSINGSNFRLRHP